SASNNRAVPLPRQAISQYQSAMSGRIAKKI
ncbi:unnamed protein product, partial [marine sediment metagenome]